MIEKIIICRCGNRYSITWPIGSVWCTLCKGYITWT